MTPPRFIRVWLLNREIARALAARKALRPYSQASARKGHETRKRGMDHA